MERLNLEFARVQRPVGQGGFHTGSLSLAEKGAEPFHFAYDCGAMPIYAASRRREIAKYVKSLGGPGSRLDLLFLSHAHADHINGVPDLLSTKTGLRVDTIVLPLTTLEERLMAFAAGAAADLRMARDTFCRRFVVDPVAALAPFGARQILFVKPGDGGAPGGGETPLDGTPRGGEQRWVGGGETGQLRASLIGKGDLPKDGFAAAGPPAMATIPDTCAIAVRAADPTLFWLFAPYVDPGVRKGRARFIARLRELTTFKLSQRTLAADVEALLNDLANHASLRKAYEHLGHDLNVTSLCLYSGPAERDDEDYAHTVRREGPYCLWGRPGWLAAGDTTLKNAAIAQAFIDHYGSHRDSVGTFVLPHHGSEYNFSAAHLVKIGPDICVVAADAYGNWRHPGTSVVQQVASLGIPLFVVTSSKSSELFECGGTLR